MNHEGEVKEWAIHKIAPKAKKVFFWFCLNIMDNLFLFMDVCTIYNKKIANEWNLDKWNIYK